jgi:hypothetical protein
VTVSSRKISLIMRTSFITVAYLNLWHFPFPSWILSRYLPWMSGSVQSGAKIHLHTHWFHTLHICLHPLKLVAYYHRSVILCSSLSCCQQLMNLWGRFLSSTTRYTHVLTTPKPLGSIETGNWIRDNEVPYFLWMFWAKGVHFDIFTTFSIWHYLLQFDLLFTGTIIHF